jgi:hypothetical protein
MASSSPDVKALFNSPAYIYNLDEQEDAQSTHESATDAYDPNADYWTPLPPIVSPHTCGFFATCS